MAQRRMFSKDVICTDKFYDLRFSAQSLYSQFNMSADDDGFVASPKRIMRTIGCTERDYKDLEKAGYIITFSSGICVITHWGNNNYIQKDRYRPTQYTEEKKLLSIAENGMYTICIQDGYSLDAQDSIGKYSVVEDSIGEEEKPSRVSRNGQFSNVFLTDMEHTNLKSVLQSDCGPYIERLSRWLAETGKRKKSHYATILNWYYRDHPEKEKKNEREKLPGITYL